MPDLTLNGAYIYIPFLFALGACVGSFLNVVVWRLPREESLNSPPSHCPKCGKFLLWRDNIPILGWIKLRGKCRFCKEPISVRYPIVEAATALLFVFYYVVFYMVHVGPASPRQLAILDNPDGVTMHAIAPPLLSVPIFFLYLLLASALLAASLIDADLFYIPEGIPWLIAIAGLLAHPFIDHPWVAGALNLGVGAGGAYPDRSIAPALAAGGTVGWLVSLLLRRLDLLPRSFPQGEPLLEVEDCEALAAEIKQARREGRTPPTMPPEYTRRQIRAEMRKEMLFLLPPMALAMAWAMVTTRIPALASAWHGIVTHDWVSGLLGSLLGGLIGGFIVWLTRILGTLVWSRVAMGLGDADLMFAVGCVLGAGPVTVAFFVAPFFGCLIAVYRLLTRANKEVPYGPYLSLASAFVMLFYTPVAAYLAPGLSALTYYVLSPLSGTH